MDMKKDPERYLIDWKILPANYFPLPSMEKIENLT